MRLQENKKARFDYSIIETYTCGIQLTGTEVKSIKESKCSISEAFCAFQKGELFVFGMHVAEYKLIKHTNHPPLRERKLLLKRAELNKLQKSINEKGLTIIPLSIFTSQRGYIKVEIGLAKGKKSYDKREAIKERDIKRELTKL